MLLCHFVHVSWSWVSLSLVLWIYSFHQIWKMFDHIFFNVFVLSCPSEAWITCIFGCFKLFQNSLILRGFKKLYFSEFQFRYLVMFSSSLLFSSVLSHVFIPTSTLFFSDIMILMSNSAVCHFYSSCFSNYLFDMWNTVMVAFNILVCWFYHLSVWGCFWLIFLITVAHIFLFLCLW